MTIGRLGRTDPKARGQEIALRDKTFGIRFDTTDAAAGTGHNQPDILSCHLASVVEQEGLQRSRHIAPPEGAATITVA